MAGGYFRLGTVRRVPIRVHWSAALGALLFGRLQFAPGVWAGFFLLILLHELGHAAVVWRFRKQVVGIDLSGMGGLCHWTGEVTAVQRAVIAWGGVAVQGLVLAGAIVFGLVVGPAQGRFANDFADALTTSNAMIIGFNLIPVPPLDGARAWLLLPLLWRRHLARRKRRTARRILETYDEVAPLPQGADGEVQLAPALEEELQRISKRSRQRRP